MRLSYLLYTLLFIGFSQSQFCQAQKEIKIKYTGFLTFNEDNPGAKVFTRDDSQQIHIIHKNMNLWCDQAIHYGNEDFIEAYGNYVKVWQQDKMTLVTSTLKHLLSELPEQLFVQIHKSFVINKEQVTAVTSDSVTLACGANIKIGKSSLHITVGNEPFCL